MNGLIMNYELQNKIPQVRFPEFKEEWEVKKLGDVIYKTDKKNKKNKDLPVYSINNTEGFLPQAEQFEGRSSSDRGFDISIYKIIQENTFAYNPARINVGSIGYSYDLKDILISSLYVCFKTKEKLNDTFLLQFLKTGFFKISVLRYQEGGVRQYLFFDSISKIKIATPSIKEQKKIAHFFSTIDQKTNQLQEKKKALEVYKKGMMQQIFAVGEKSITNKSITNYELKNDELDTTKTRNSSLVIPNYIRFKDDNGQDFPDWEVKKLGEVGETYNGLSGKTKEDFGVGKPYIQYKQIFDNSIIEIDNFGLVNIKEKDKQNKAIYGDVFFTVSSETPKEIGMSSVLLDTIDELYLNSFCFGFRPKSLDVLIPDFSRYLFRSEIMRKEIIKLAQGSTRYNMSKIQFVKIKFSLPCKKEQTKIANFLSKIDEKIENVNQQIVKTKEWKKGLLQKMFV